MSISTMVRGWFASERCPGEASLKMMLLNVSIAGAHEVYDRELPFGFPSGTRQYVTGGLEMLLVVPLSTGSETLGIWHPEQRELFVLVYQDEQLVRFVYNGLDVKPLTPQVLEYVAMVHHWAYDVIGG